MTRTNAIPAAVRRAVLQRDHGTCRLCGRRGVHLHHIRFGGGEGPGMGGRRQHDPNLIVTLCEECHTVRAHGSKTEWSYWLLEAILHPGQTALALRRQARLRGEI